MYINNFNSNLLFSQAPQTRAGFAPFIDTKMAAKSNGLAGYTRSHIVKEQLVNKKAEELMANINNQKTNQFNQPIIRKGLVHISDVKNIRAVNSSFNIESKNEIDCTKILRETLMSLRTSIQNGNESIDTSKLFFREISKKMEKFSTSDKLNLLLELITKHDELDPIFKKIVVGINKTIEGETEKFLSNKEIAKLKANIFGLDLQEFLIKNVAVENLSDLKRFMTNLNKCKLFNATEKNDIKSSILCVLSKHLIDKNTNSDSPYSFKELKSYIDFIELESMYGPQIVSSVLIDNTLAVESDDEFSDDETFPTNQANTNPKTDEFENHLSVLDNLSKLAALSRLKEFNPKKLNLPEFIAMLKETEIFLGDINEEHALFQDFYQQSSKIIEKYNNNLEVFNLTDLKKNLKPVYDRLFSKFNHDELEIEFFTENDISVANEFALEELVHNYLDMGFTYKEAQEMAKLDIKKS